MRKQSRTDFIRNRPYFKRWAGPWERGPQLWYRLYEDIWGSISTHLGPMLPKRKSK